MPAWNRSSLRARTTWATGAVAALVCIGFSMLFLVFVGNQESESAETRATAGWDRVLPIIKLGQLPSVLPESRGDAIQVLNAHGRVVSATHQLVGRPPIATLPPGNDAAVRSQRSLCHVDGLTGCKTVVLFKVFQPDGIWLVNVAVPGVPWYGNRTVLSLVIGMSLLMTTMMAVGVSRAVGKTLGPVDAIRTELKEITGTGLHRRVPVPLNQDEIRLLAETVNATLDRLEGAYEQLRQFTSDASHDLRSPITAMRAQVEEGLMYPDDTDWPRTATEVLTGIDRLQAIVTDLLNLAKLDAGVMLNRRPTDLANMIAAELDRRTYRVRIVRRFSRSVVVDCDRLRVIRLLTNLLDNAERHADEQITIIVRADGPMAVLEVLDDGAGIAPEHRETVFDRFTRLEASRSRDAGGTGLGLPIARQIAQAHDGTLTIDDSAQGARFVLRLPRCDNSH
ncbi:sensor histidine kinase [Actinomadura alba]|uniref:histidine kinase n=1 Tax=Actinomadura alba TaxID=406431 RepID=A0ABR7LZE6_9ACTN|nr:HAMP domain-containing sensor histidine kinase [Actinomadura alba]MBC6470169.1 HAMP domain-containing histidine kinase [Actinomadura alba]